MLPPSRLDDGLWSFSSHRLFLQERLQPPGPAGRQCVAHVFLLTVSRQMSDSLQIILQGKETVTETQRKRNNGLISLALYGSQFLPQNKNKIKVQPEVMISRFKVKIMRLKDVIYNYKVIITRFKVIILTLKVIIFKRRHHYVI